MSCSEILYVCLPQNAKNVAVLTKLHLLKVLVWSESMCGLLVLNRNKKVDDILANYVRK